MMPIGVAPITQVSHVRNKKVTFKGGHLMWFPYYKELLIKESIHSIWEQILSYERSTHFKKVWRKSVLDE